MSVTSIKSKLFKAVSASTTAVAPAQQLSGAGDLNLTSVGVNDGSNLATTVSLTSAANLSAINFTITGTDESGAVVSEVKAGPNANTVETTQTYQTVTSISANAAVGSDVSAGFSATSTSKGVLFNGATRVRGLQALSKNAAGVFTIKDGSQTGTALLSIDTAADNPSVQIEPYIPDEGILFRNGAYVEITPLTSLTVFFDG